jgi:ribonuclease R
MYARRTRNPWIAGLLVAVLTLLIGLWLGGHPSWLPSPIRSAFVSQSSSDKLEDQVLGLLSKDYYRPVNRTQLVNQGLEAAVASLKDPYSHYYDPSDYQSFQNETNPHLSGVGIDVGTEPQGLRVEDVFAGSPAAKAGIGRGDVITEVGSTSLANRSASFSASLIKGRAGTKVTLTVLSGKRKRTVSLVRADITIPVAAGRIVTYHGTKLGYVELTSFTAGSGSEVRAQVDKVLHQGARGVILDLRENGGGLLEEAVNLASIFIPDGTIVSTDGRSQPRQVYTAKGNAISTKIPVVVLVDRGTASAAEIVTVAGPQPRQGGRHANLRQGCLSGDPAAAQRGRARLHRRRVLHAQRAQPRRRWRAPGRRPPAQRLRLHESALAHRHRAVGGRADGRRRAPVTPPVRDARPGARVALLARQGKFLVAEPFFGSGPRVVVSRDRRADVGDLIVLGPGRPNGRGASRRAVIARRLGRPDVARDVITALMLDRGLRGGFDPAVEHEARKAAEIELELGGRRDLRTLPTFTIDPVTARDFDDAVSAEALPDGSWRVWVHIADVAAYVRSRSIVDREAYRRATSVYVPGAVEPMLPSALSNQACSLVAGEDRLTVTVELTIGPRAVRGASLYRSVIRSDERLDYDRVDRIFAGDEAAADPWGGPLAAARAAAGALAQRRDVGGAVVLDSPEPEFSFDRDGDVVAAELSTQTESHRLIEQLMIAANERVAQFLAERKIPTLYRVHQRPEAPAVERLIDQLESLGVPTPPVPKGHLTPQQAADVVGEASSIVADWVKRTGRGGRALTSLVLRSLKQAYYEDRNLGHAGLASTAYCHFTSPIRRYPDLICHRGVLSAIAGEPAPDAAWVQAAGPWTSTREREAMTIERDADDIARCFLLARRLSGSDRDMPMDGEVVGLIGAGAFIAFGAGLQYEGMLPVRRLRGDWWELNEQGTVLVGTRSGGALRLGDPIQVRVGRIDAPRGRVDLLPADADEN